MGERYPGAWYPPAPERSVLRDSLRWGCLLFLLASLVLALTPRYPQHAEFGDLLRDVQAGDTANVYLENRGGGTVVSWQTGPLVWYEADFRVPGAVTAGDPGPEWVDFDGIRVSFRTGPDCCGGLTGARYAVETVASEAGRAVTVRDHRSVRTDGFRLAYGFDDRTLPSGVGLVVGGLWFVLLVMMLLTRDHPYANRWAWFWLFGVGVGPVLLLAKEPVPLRLRYWRVPPPRRPRAEPLSGWTGLGYAVLWGLGLTLASLFYRWLTR